MARTGAGSRRRVVQWTTGNVGRRGILATLAHPELELVGCYVTPTGGKAGREVADLVGLERPTGIVATDDADALLALRPDCVVYTPKFLSVDELVRILSSGADVVATAGFITGHSLGEGRARLLAACEAGGSSLFGSGMNPGFANLLAVVAGGTCDRIDSVSVLESVDCTGYDSPETEMPCGFGRPMDDPALPAMAAAGTAVFEDVVWLTAEALGFDLDEVRCDASFAAAPQDLDLGSWRIDAGCVAGVSANWRGLVDGRVVVDLAVRWRKGSSLVPDWKIEHGYTVRVSGMPSVRLRYDILPPQGFQGASFEDLMVLGMVATVMPAIHAIPAVCDARPGIVTYLDLPLVTPRLGRAGTLAAKV